MNKTKRIALIAIIVLGGIFRFAHINWDTFSAFHPDERNISWAVTRIHFFDQLNPKFFAYGGLPIYLYRGLGEAVVTVTRDPVWLFDWGHIAVIGRTVSAILSTVSIALIFLVGALYFSPAVGLLSAGLLAFSPWAIREAHFATTETMLVFFLLLLLLLARRRNSWLLGLVWGLALAAKTTSLLFGVIPGVALLMHKKFRDLVRMVSVALITFFLLSPYTLLDFVHFRESMTYESGVALGQFTVPYTLQFLHTPRYLYQIMTMLWQTGPVAILGVLGLLALLIRARRNIVFLVFPLLYFGWVGTWYAKFARYNVPFLPFVTIAAAWICALVIKKHRIAGYIFTLALFVITAAWGMANFSIYFRPQTRLTATDWIDAHIPAGAVIYTEHWNDGLPLDRPDAPQYNRELLTAYDIPDDNTKREYYGEMLSRGDYIILSTRRIWATMPRLGEKYPVTSRFYSNLLSGRLGYTEVATFSSYPELFGLTINDDNAEESVAVFDHPTVRIFKNSSRLTKDALLSIL